MTAKTSVPPFYVASRVRHAAMWLQLRALGYPITSTWIDEAGEGQTTDFADLWTRIISEVTASDWLLLFAVPDDVPLKGALVEVGAALAAGRQVVAVLPAIQLEPRSMRPIGSWLNHPLVSTAETIGDAIALFEREQNS